VPDSGQAQCSCHIFSRGREDPSSGTAATAEQSSEDFIAAHPSGMEPNRLTKPFISGHSVIHVRIKRSNNVARSAGRFLNALRAVERRDLLVSQIIIAEGRSVDKVSREEVADLFQQLDDVQGLLAKIAAISPEQIWKLRRGQPRNLGAHFVLRDAAAIFEWYSGMKAARRVDRIGSNETGPFFRFASALWPVIFGQGTAGLPAAMKTWHHWRVRGERSAVMANMALRHPTWGIFDSW
jgi:hypothetical protein